MAAAAAAAAAMASTSPTAGFNNMLHHSMFQKQSSMSSPFFLPAGIVHLRSQCYRHNFRRKHFLKKHGIFFCINNRKHTNQHFLYKILAENVF
jgi:hypothetical protein